MSEKEKERERERERERGNIKFKLHASSTERRELKEYNFGLNLKPDKNKKVRSGLAYLKLFRSSLLSQSVGVSRELRLLERFSRGHLQK